LIHTCKLPFTICCLALLAFAGCAHRAPELGAPTQQIPLPEGAPSITEVLASLAATDAEMRNFRASGKFILKSPELEETFLVPQSTIHYQSPANLSVIGRKMGSPVGRLTCTGDEFLLELPTKRQYLHALEGARFESLSENVSPIDIAREAFLPETWALISEDRVQLRGFDATDQRVFLDILDARRRHVHRRVEVTGPPWVLRRSELLDERGDVVAITAKDDYRDFGGKSRFAAQIESTFPGESAFMSFSMRTFELNTEVAPELFAISERLREIKARDFTPIRQGSQAGKRK